MKQIVTEFTHLRLDNNYYLDVLLNDLLIIAFYTTFWEFVMNTFDRDRRYSGICFQGMEFAKDINQGSWIGLISNYPLPAVGSGQLEIKTHPIMLKLFFTQGVCLEQHNLIWKRFLDCVTVPFRQGLMVLSHLLVSATNCWCFCLKSVPFRFTSSTLDHQPTIIPSRRSIRTQSYGDKDWFSSLHNCVWPDLGFALWDGWQFYVEEVKGTVNYQGFILPRRRGEFVSFILPSSTCRLFYAVSYNKSRVMRPWCVMMSLLVLYYTHLVEVGIW